MSLLQLHDKADFSDIVLRDQISRIVFVVLPQISAGLIKACKEEALRGSAVIESATKAIGRFLCLVFEDYQKQAPNGIANVDFMNLLKEKEETADDADVLKPGNQSPAAYIANLEKSTRWMLAASKKLAPAVKQLEILRGSEHRGIRNELAVLSWNLLHKCQPNIRSMSPFLLENLILFTDDSDEKIREFSQTSLGKLTAALPELNQEIAELFSSHLIVMPRMILTGDESEQIAGLTLLNSFVLTLHDDHSKLHSMLSNPAVLEKLINVMLSCCEIDVLHDLLFHESLTSAPLDDQFYHMKLPWKQLRNLKGESITKKFSDICHNLGRSSMVQTIVNHLLDNMNSLEYLVLLVEILNSQGLTLASDQVEGIVEEFLNETYWSMPIKATPMVEKKHREEFFEESTPGLYESAVEVRVRDVTLDDDSGESSGTNLKAIKYNVLCTCLVVELMGTAATVLGRKFQRFMLRTLHQILEKAGSSNFLIRTAGLHALELIASAMGFDEVSQLIDDNSDFILFNIQKLLKRNTDNDHILDMLAAVLQFSRTSRTSHINNIVETVADQIALKKNSKSSSDHLKLFRLYVGSFKRWEAKVEDKTEVAEVTSNWDEFLQRCLFVLDKSADGNEETSRVEDVSEDAHEEVEEAEPTEHQKADDELPEHVELVLKILTSSLQFFASNNPSEVILTHEIFTDGLPMLQHYQNQLLPMIHQMWYPFTKQFQSRNLVVLQNSFRLFLLIAELAKDFVCKRSTDDVFPVLNKFLNHSMGKNAKLSYSQEFKLQKEILGGYGALAVAVEVDERLLDVIVDVLLKFSKSSSDVLASASKSSLERIQQHNPGLICFKTKFF